MRPVLVYAIAAACLLAGCGKANNGGPGVPADAARTAAALTGDAKGEPSDNPQCKLFTAAELAQYVGEPLAAPHNAAAGTGCQWTASGGSGHVLVQVVRASDHTPPSGATGFRRVPDIGKDGFVYPELGGWQAGAIQGDKGVEVDVSGKTATAETALALLKESLKRMAG
jgi:hypothetical protein